MKSKFKNINLVSFQLFKISNDVYASVKQTTIVRKVSALIWSVSRIQKATQPLFGVEPFTFPAAIFHSDRANFKADFSQQFIH